MEFIGITGGAGAGKSEILKFIRREYPAYVLLADELAHELMLPGTDCFKEIQTAFRTEDIFSPQGELDKKKLAAVIFSDAGRRKEINDIVHPAVKREILKRAGQERESGKFSYFILEAALLIEEGYDKICDELWYIDASRQTRRRRLKETRGYSDAKIDAMFESQLSEEEYKTRCNVVIENNGSLEEAFCRIREAFADRSRKKMVRR